MSGFAIEVEDLSKRYRIGLKDQTQGTFLAALASWAVSPLVRFKRLNQLTSFEGNGEESDVIWALRDISVKIAEGEVVGIIGRNGAGKSTLLKILSRITEPTSGHAVINGRVASLLEVGTGFHADLTGRENIYLNGTILGMTKKEVDRKFEQIVAFAEIERFVDTPVKHYSSGMYMRLAFAVAAHLEPEILLVDEVLAVGDIAFQKKCLGKMEDISANEGRTVLFVSHNMSAVQSLCSKAIWIDAGRLEGYGDVVEQVNGYVAKLEKNEGADRSFPLAIDERLQLQRFSLSPNPVVSCDSLDFRIELSAVQPSLLKSVVILIHSHLDTRIAAIDLRTGETYRLNGQAPLCIEGAVRALPLMEGEYRIHLMFRYDHRERHVLDVMRLSVQPRPPRPGVVPFPPAARGVLELDSEFEVR